LAVYRDSKKTFTTTDQVMGKLLAYVTGVALHQVQMLMEKRHAAYRKQQQLDLWEQAQQASDLPALLSTLLRRSVNLLGADAGLLGLRLSEQRLSYYPCNVPPQMKLPSAQQRNDILWQVMRGEETVSLPDYGRSPQARESWVDANVHAFLGVPLQYENKTLGVFAFFHLSAHKQFTLPDRQAAEALARLASAAIYTLRQRQRLQERIAEFSQALQRQTDLDQQKDAFIHGMSHELRTPLGIILGHAELLESEMLGSLSQAQIESVQIIARRTRMINKLVDDLSVLLAAQTQEFQRETLDPSQLLYGMLADFQLQARDKGITLTADIMSELPLIKGDPTHLRRVFDNLLSNALKFTPEGGSVSLQAEATGDDVVFAVSDTGAGMPQDQLDRIFERFYQVRSQKDHPGGTGLGLALVREIVEAHRGRVRVESELGDGSLFEVRLPAHHEDAEGAG
jgi:signal transduction histidine kinase